MVQKKYKILLIAPLLLISCKPKRVITEKISTMSDSSAFVFLENEISGKEIQSTTLQSDLNRFKEESLLLWNDVSTHEIIYDTSLPVNQQTNKPPISNEIITISNTHLEKKLNEYEILLREASIENTNLTTKNSNLVLTVESLIKEKKTQKTVTNTGLRFKYILLYFGILIGILLNHFFIYLMIKFKNK